MQPNHAEVRASRAGFTRLDLLILLLTLAALAAVTRPAVGTSGSVQSAVCMDNFRRLSAAWLLYAQDNEGRFVGNYHGVFVPAPTGKERPWATGWLDWTVSSDNTNTAYLTDARYAALAPYLGKDATVYRCPADEFLNPQQLSRGWPARARSTVMNAYVGEGNTATGPIDTSYPTVTQLTGFVVLPPQSTFVFTEEHPDSINDPTLFVSMSQWQWIDLPASFHEGACDVAFADGHVELHAWREPTTLKPVAFIYSPVNSPNSVDLAWVRARTSAR